MHEKVQGEIQKDDIESNDIKLSYCKHKTDFTDIDTENDSGFTSTCSSSAAFQRVLKMFSDPKDNYFNSIIFQAGKVLYRARDEVKA